jgi:phosphoribosyl 1,2-cyclic phosphodiesterase
MNLKVLGSSSSGNCYILEDQNEALIIEAGIRFPDVKKALNFQLRKVVGCLISHVHGDHAKYACNMVESGIYTLALRDVFREKQITGNKAIPVETGRGYKIGNFKVVPFPAFHDVPCVGYIIEHPQSGRIMFLTDSCKCDYVFPGLNHILIEANYYDKKLIENITKGHTYYGQRERLIDTHMEIRTCCQFLRDNDLRNVMNIVLLHLSNDNSDAPFFVSEIQKLTGKTVYAAKPGLTVGMSLI